MTPAVRRTYGTDTSGEVSSRRSPPSSNGPISIRAVTNWLDTSPRMLTVPPRRSGPVTVTGRRPATIPVVDVGTEALEGVVQLAHRAGAQRRVAVDGDRRVGEGGEGGDETRRRPGQPGVEPPSSRPDPSVAAADEHDAVDRRPRRRRRGPPGSAASLWCRRRRARWSTVLSPSGKGGGDERPVGDALRSGNRHLAVHRAGGGAQALHDSGDTAGCRPWPARAAR